MLYALVLSGQAGAHLLAHIGMSTSAETFVRLAKRAASPSIDAPEVLGVDEFGATRSRTCSCKDSHKEDLTWGYFILGLFFFPPAVIMAYVVQDRSIRQAPPVSTTV
ncbi:MAG: hypothetical protein ACXVCM_19755 [Ktedonobacteraceae bacterium]